MANLLHHIMRSAFRFYHPQIPDSAHFIYDPLQHDFFEVFFFNAPHSSLSGSQAVFSFLNGDIIIVTGISVPGSR
jgi:hypothetical protein